MPLPARFTFFKEEERTEYLACYQSKLKLRQQITSAYTASIRQRLINLLEGINSRIRTIPSGQAVQEKHFIQGLIYTGDKYLLGYLQSRYQHGHGHLSIDAVER